MTIDVARLRTLIADRKRWLEEWRGLPEIYEAINNDEMADAVEPLLDVFEAACRWADDLDSTDQELIDVIGKARA